MNTGKYAYLLLAAALLLLPTGASALEVITDHFYQIPIAQGLCADLESCIAGVPVAFQGVTPWSTRRAAGPVPTNSLGIACVNVIWPQGIYTVQAQSNGEVSDPVAVAFWQPNGFYGAISAGELHIYRYGFFPNNLVTQEYRRATAAMIFTDPLCTGRCATFGVIYYDPDNPVGAVTFTTKTFQQVVRTPKAGYESMEFRGVGYLQQGAGPRKLVRYYLYVDDLSGDNYFCLDIYDLTGKLIYYNDGCHLYEGATEVELCLGS